MGIELSSRKTRIPAGARFFLPALVGLLLATPVGALDLSLEGPCSGEPWTDEEFSLWIRSPDSLSLGAYRADILFDPAVFRVLYYQQPLDGPFAAGPTVSNAPAPGVLSVSGLACGSALPQRGRVLVGRLRLRILGNPGISTSISVAQAEVLDAAGVRKEVETNQLDFVSVAAPDRDCDDVIDASDNCPAVYNPDQADGDEDGIGDTCIGLSVTLASFSAQVRDRRVVVRWETSSETATAGFHLYRSVAPTGPWVRLTPALVPARGDGAAGAAYEFVDRPPRRLERLWYLLQDVTTAGAVSSHGPIVLVVGKPRARAGIPPRLLIESDVGGER